MPRTMSMTAFVEDCESKTDAVMRDFAPFTTGTRVVLLLRRHKEGGSTNEYRRRLDRQVSHSPEQFRKVLFLMFFVKYLNGDAADYRIYSTACPRDIRKAEMEFKMETLDADFAGGENKKFFYEHFDDKWVSALMSSNPIKDESLFLADIDYSDEVPRPFDICAAPLKWCAENNIEVVKQYPTKNGWHLLLKPFNLTLWPKEFGEIKKDPLMLLAW